MRKVRFNQIQILGMELKKDRKVQEINLFHIIIRAWIC